MHEDKVLCKVTCTGGGAHKTSGGKGERGLIGYLVGGGEGLIGYLVGKGRGAYRIPGGEGERGL